MENDQGIVIGQNEVLASTSQVDTYLIGTKTRKIYKGLKISAYVFGTIIFLSALVGANLFLYSKHTREMETTIKHILSNSQWDNPNRDIGELDNSSASKREESRELSDFNLPLLFFHYMPIEMVKEIPSIILKGSDNKYEYAKINWVSKDSEETALYLSNSKRLSITNERAWLLNERGGIQVVWEFGVDYVEFLEEIKNEFGLEEQELLLQYLSEPMGEYEIGNVTMPYDDIKVSLPYEKSMITMPIQGPLIPIKKGYSPQGIPLVMPRVPEHYSNFLGIPPQVPKIEKYQVATPLVSNDHEIKSGAPSTRFLKEEKMTAKERSWDKKMAFFAKVSQKFIKKAAESGTGVVSFSNPHMQDVIRAVIEAQSF